MKTDAEKNRELRKHFGWTFHDQEPKGDAGSMYSGKKWAPPDGNMWSPWHKTEEKATDYAKSRLGLPDYFADDASGLWACHKAMLSLNPKQLERMAFVLYYQKDVDSICDSGGDIDFAELFKLASRTPAQLADALWTVLCGEDGA